MLHPPHSFRTFSQWANHVPRAWLIYDQVGLRSQCLQAGVNGSGVKAKQMRDGDWTTALTATSRGAVARHNERTAVPPPDDAAHQDSMLMAELATLNTLVARYILRSMGMENRDVADVSPTDERSLANLLVSAADGLRARASRRERDHRR